ncbi:ZIP family metal transporter [Sutterella massiliensis]|uniref:ZIP family metal transporter n=1 Tax=Sutterella massiliensis TaxID=1816689 RepID=A0ABS2DQL1_9BURK|nr:ZIP family metal transporter [Sutterella massiliensis]MBM6703634.1 ZIP family metal transporter [Sutterella massiliensis]
MLEQLFPSLLDGASPVTAAASATGFTFFMTAVGAAIVLLPGRIHNAFMQTISLGFAAGVMVAASVWSLLLPAMAMVEARGESPLLPAVGGFLLGVAFIFLLDRFMPHMHPMSSESEGPKTKLARSTLLFLAVTLHNIPEGMSVGLSIGMAADDPTLLAGALALALGMGIQNIPEGAAVALPLLQDGMSRGKAFLAGAFSGLAELVFGVLAVLLVGTTGVLLPWFLAFAAGAMIYVVVEELIPSAHLTEHSDAGTLSVVAGFVVMMALDVGLG